MPRLPANIHSLIKADDPVILIDALLDTPQYAQIRDHDGIGRAGLDTACRLRDAPNIRPGAEVGAVRTPSGRIRVYVRWSVLGAEAQAAARQLTRRHSGFRGVVRSFLGGDSWDVVDVGHAITVVPSTGPRVALYGRFERSDSEGAEVLGYAEALAEDAGWTVVARFLGTEQNRWDEVEGLFDLTESGDCDAILAPGREHFAWAQGEHPGVALIAVPDVHVALFGAGTAPLYGGTGPCAPSPVEGLRHELVLGALGEILLREHQPRWRHLTNGVTLDISLSVAEAAAEYVVAAEAGWSPRWRVWAALRVYRHGWSIVDARLATDGRWSDEVPDTDEDELERQAETEGDLVLAHSREDFDLALELGEELERRQRARRAPAPRVLTLTLIGAK